MFIKVKAYYRGHSVPPGDMVLNVNQIVAFWDGGTIRNSSGEDVPCVYLDTTTMRGLCIDSTVEKLQAIASGQDYEITAWPPQQFEPKREGER